MLLLFDARAPACQVKDLGPQFSYRGVFLVEYAGPILIMIIVGTRPAILYGERWPTLPWTNNAM